MRDYICNTFILFTETWFDYSQVLPRVRDCFVFTVVSLPLKGYFSHEILERDIQETWYMAGAFFLIIISAWSRDKPKTCTRVFFPSTTAVEEEEWMTLSSVILKNLPSYSYPTSYHCFGLVSLPKDVTIHLTMHSFWSMTGCIKVWCKSGRFF